MGRRNVSIGLYCKIQLQHSCEFTRGLGRRPGLILRLGSDQGQRNLTSFQEESRLSDLLSATRRCSSPVLKAILPSKAAQTSDRYIADI